MKPPLEMFLVSGALFGAGHLRGKFVTALFLAVLLAGCATRHEAILASSVADRLSQPESALIIGRVLVRDKHGLAPDSSWIKPSLHIAHAPSSADLAEQSRQHEGIFHYLGDFVTSASTDAEGYFYYFVPPGRYKVNYVHPYGRPLLAFDVLQPGRTYYLGTLVFDKGGLSNTLNELTFPEVVDQSERVESDLREKLAVSFLADFKKSGFYPLPCSFTGIGHPRGEDHWGPPKNAALGRDPIAITVSQFQPRTKFDPLMEGKLPAASKLAGGGMVEGAVEGAIVPLSHPVTFVLYPFIAPITIAAGAVIGGAVGGVTGTVLGLNEDDVQKLNVAIGAAFGGMSLQESLAERFQMAAKGARADVVVRSDWGPRAKGEDIEYAPLRNEGYAEYVELSLMKVGLNVAKSDPPRLTLLLSIRMKFGSLNPMVPSQTRYLEFASRQVGLDQLVANQGERLTKTVRDSLDLVGHCMAEALFPELPAALSR